MSKLISGGNIARLICKMIFYHFMMHFSMRIRQHRSNSTRNNYSMSIISSETLAQDSESLLLKSEDTISFFFVDILDDSFDSKPRFLRGD